MLLSHAAIQNEEAEYFALKNVSFTYINCRKVFLIFTAFEYQMEINMNVTGSFFSNDGWLTKGPFNENSHSKLLQMHLNHSSLSI